jgi:biopolymer transport protein ExbD
VFLGAAVDVMSVAKKAGAKNIAILTSSDQK